MQVIKLGLSTTLINSATTNSQLDGIGTYTKKLFNHFTREATFKVFPVVYPFSARTMVDLTLGKLPLNEKIDLFHATDYRIPRLKKCSVIATLHDAIPLKHPEWVNVRLRDFKNYVLKKSAKWADHIIALSASAIPDLVEYYGISENNISVVHCGVDESWLNALDSNFINAVLKKYQLTKPYYLFVGTLQPRKNLQRMIEAFRLNNSDHQLVIVGKHGWNVDDVVPLLNKGKVIWLRNIIDEGELRAIYQGAQVFVFPSLYEGFGIPVLEAFASRVPVITSNTTSLPEVAQDAAILVNPLSVEDIAEAMKKLSEDSLLRTNCIAKGLGIAKEKSWKKCADETLKIYQKLL